MAVALWQGEASMLLVTQRADVMTRQFSISILTCAMVFGLLAMSPLGAAAQDASSPLTLASAKVSIAGTSNIHEFEAVTREVRVTRMTLASGVAGAGLIAAVLNPGAVEGFDLAIRAASLSSPKEGLDKNMHKALKADEFKDITFRVMRIEGKPGALKAIGTLTIAGVAREIGFDLNVKESASALHITGNVPLLMTNYGIAPPKAMLGMLKTDDKIVVSFEVVLATPSTLTR
jgi:polyisoprenoid-binding protein YceI